MKREFKFRVWDKEDKCWIDMRNLRIGNTGVLYLPFGLSPGNENRFTIQQFINLKDTNEKDIYEGDIVRFQYRDEGEFYGVVGNIFENPELLNYEN